MNSTKSKLCQAINENLPQNTELVPEVESKIVILSDNLNISTEQFLAGFGDVQCFRTFYDPEKKGDGKNFNGSHTSNSYQLQKHNKEKRGVFFIPNRGGHKDKYITEITSVYMDLDDVPIQPVLDAINRSHLIPYAIVQSSPGDHYHIYWLVRDFSVERFRLIQSSFIKPFGHDYKVINEARVLRLPGYLHQKAEPFLVKVVFFSPDAPKYSEKQIIDSLGLTIEAPAKPRIVAQKSTIQKSGPTKGSEHRNDTLCSLAGKLEAKNRTYDEILARCQAENTLFKEPVGERKIMEVVNWIWEKRQERVEQLAFFVEQLKKLEAGTPRVEAIANDKATDLLLLAKDTDPVLWSTLEDLFKSRNKLSYLKNAVKPGPVLTLAGTTDNLLLSEIPGCPKEYPGAFDCYPTVPGYKIQQTDRGVKVFKDGSEHPEEVSSTPVFLTKRLIKDRSDVDLEAAWLERGRWRYLEAPRSSFFNANRILDLGDKGFPVGTANSRKLAQYLQVFESIHISLIPEKNVSSQMGWKGNSFLLGKEWISDTDDSMPIEFHGLDDGEESLVGGIRQRGDYNKWVKAVESMQHYPLPATILYASFAAPLLKILEQSSFGVDISNRTSTAKTISLRLGGSVWGQPDEHNSPSVTHTWDNTNVAVERLCSAMCDLPVILDDTKRQKTEKISDNLYTITHGQGRGRGSKTGMQITRSWRVVLLSSGEAAAVSYTHNAGVRARILSLRGAPFGGDNQETRKLVNNLNDVTKHNYGHAGPIFVKWLVDNQERWPEFREKLRDNIATLTANTGVSSRLADMAAIITTAGQLVHEALNLPWAFTDPISKVWPQLLKDSKDADICDRALVIFGDYVASHPDRFFNQYTDEKAGKAFVPNSGFYGRCDDSITRPWTHIDFLPSRLKDICKSEGLDYGAVIQGFEDKKMINLKASCKINSCSRKVVRISKQTLEGDESGGCSICAKNNGCEKEPCEWDSWADRCAMFVEDTAPNGG